MSTPTGQSRLQPLHDRHRSSASATSADRHPSPITCPFAISNSNRARPRVECISSPGGPEARAHHPAVRGDALADAQAAAGGAGEAAPVVGERELRGVADRRQPDEHAQVVVQLRGPHHAVRVEPAVGVPDALELLERLDDRRRVHPGQQLGAGGAVAVLARERPAVRDGEVRRVFQERPEVRDPGPRRQVEVDPHVQAAVAEVPVVDAAPTVPVTGRCRTPAGRRRTAPAAPRRPPSPARPRRRRASA